MKLKSHINQLVQEAFTQAGIDESAMSVTESGKPEFGDYQFNGAMALAKKLKRNPRDIATELMVFFKRETSY